MSISTIAELLWNAEKNRTPIPSLRSDFPSLSLDDAYKVQAENVTKREKAGEKLVGYKIGLTSREAQKHFNLTHPDLGHLFQEMEIPNGSEVSISQLIQPKIEAEIALVMGKELRSENLTPEEVADAVEAVVGAFEIIDSRIENWNITAQDTVCDNGSSSRFVLSERWLSPEGIDLATVGMAMYQNGDVMLTGAGSQVMGNPVYAATFLAKELGKVGRHIKPGDIILTGSLGGMLKMVPNQEFAAEFLKLGRVMVGVVA